MLDTARNGTGREVAPPALSGTIKQEHSTTPEELAAAGWRLFPCREDKRPAVTSWTREATSNVSQVAEWRRRGARIFALALPADTVVVDCDTTQVVNGTASLRSRDLETPATCRAASPRGLHLYYTTDQPLHCRNGLLPGVDIKTAGGYVVIPPAPGRRWIVPLHRDAMAPAPEWVAQLLEEGGKGKARPAGEWRKLTSEGIDQGGRNEALAALAGHLLRHYIDPFVALDLLLAWNTTSCRPPLSRAEVERTVDSIAAAELRRRASLGK